MEYYEIDNYLKAELATSCQVIKAEITINYTWLCDGCKEPNDTFLFKLGSSSGRYLNVCEACAQILTTEEDLINHLSEKMYIIDDFRDQHLEIFKWESKSEDAGSIFEQLGIDDKTETHYLDFFPELTSYSVWYQSSNNKWLCYKNLAKSRVGYRHKDDTFSTRLPGTYSTRDDAKAAVYIYLKNLELKKDITLYEFKSHPCLSCF